MHFYSKDARVYSYKIFVGTCYAIQCHKLKDHNRYLEDVQSGHLTLYRDRGSSNVTATSVLAQTHLRGKEKRPKTKNTDNTPYSQRSQTHNFKYNNIKGLERAVLYVRAPTRGASGNATS